MSALVPASIASSDLNPGAPVRASALASASASMSQTPTSSARSVCLSRASKWLAEIRPHPTSANRILRSRDERLGDEHGSGGRGWVDAKPAKYGA